MNEKVNNNVDVTIKYCQGVNGFAFSTRLEAILGTQKSFLLSLAKGSNVGLGWLEAVKCVYGAVMQVGVSKCSIMVLLFTSPK